MFAPDRPSLLNTRDVRLDAETEMFLVIGITCVAIALLVFWVEPLSIVGVLERLTPDVRGSVRPIAFSVLSRWPRNSESEWPRVEPFLE
jgi:hypothetical protein